MEAELALVLHMEAMALRLVLAHIQLQVAVVVDTIRVALPMDVTEVLEEVVGHYQMLDMELSLAIAEETASAATAAAAAGALTQWALTGGHMTEVTEAAARLLECRGKEQHEEAVAEVVLTAVGWLVVGAQVVADRALLAALRAMERPTQAVEEEGELAVGTEATAAVALLL